MQGLGLGADDYLTKPFDLALLKQKIKTIIRNRESVRQKTLRLIKVPDNESILANEHNDFFLKKCEEYKKSKYYLTSSITGLTVVGSNTSINRINQMLKSFTEWKASSIDERQAMLSGLAKEIWKIEEYR